MKSEVDIFMFQRWLVTGDPDLRPKDILLQSKPLSDNEKYLINQVLDWITR